MATAKRSAKPKQPRKRESTAAQRGSSGIDRRHQNKGRVENLIPHQWKPGQSGNPSGRHTTSHDELKKLIQEIGNEAHPDRPDLSRLEIMLRSMMVSKNATDHSNILEHGFGKVPNELTGKDGGPIEMKDVSDLTDEQRIARLAAIFDAARTRRSGPSTDDPAKP